MTTNSITEQYEKYLKASFKFVSKNAIRRVLTGVYHHPNGSLIATDEYRLIQITEAHEEPHKLIDKKGEFIDGRYPDASRLIPNSFCIELVDVDILDWLKGHETIDTVAKEDKQNHTCKLIMNGQIAVCAESESMDNIIHSFNNTSNGSHHLTIHYNAKFMIETMKVLKSLGYKTCTIRFNKHRDPIVITSGNVTILLMPINPPQKKSMES